MAFEQRDTGDEPPPLALRAESDPVAVRPPSGGAASAQAILTAVGETVYEWDVKSDRLRWGGNAGEVLGLRDMRAVASGAAYDALVDPESVTTRHQAVRNGLGIDYGSGVPYEISYALKLPRHGAIRSIWVNDCGLWFADADGNPSYAHGVVRLTRSQATRPATAAAPELPRRTEFLKLLENVLAVARHYRTRYAFVGLSFDNLPMVADAFGPAALDEAETVVIGRVRGALRGGDLAGRLSDSEMGLILKVGDEKEATHAIERIVRAVGDEMVATSAGPIGALVSAGIVMIPAGAGNVEDCVARARRAQREARSRGPGQHAFHSMSRQPGRPKLADAAAADLITRALRDDRLVLALQPAVRAGCGEVAFHECLSRLAQDDGTLVPMGEAIVVAEALGLMRLIDLKVQDLALAILEREPARTLAVNASAETLADRSWLDRLTKRLSGRPDLAGRLIVEITETALIQDVAAASEAMAHLKRMGCRTAIDDFGAGYTSFRNLQMLPVDIVKIDGSFIRHYRDRPDNAVFVKTLVSLAKNFRLETVAEMVENRPTATELEALGIDYLQGYHFGRPEPCFAPDPAARPAALVATG
jgi:diguanylate cyclase (GGDEF)-like protein